MKIVIFGATGNTGTSLIRALLDEDQVDSIIGVARRRPILEIPKVKWEEADVVKSDLLPVVSHAYAVVHLAWLIQPSHNPEVVRRANLLGTKRILDAIAEGGVRSLVYASSIGAYSPGNKKDRVDEAWPTEGILTSPYSRQKATVEKMLDRFEADVPGTRVVRMRPALVFKRQMASEARRFFLGPFFPGNIANPRLLPVLPNIPGLVTQCVHSLDAAEAYRLALLADVRGAFNVATEPHFDGRDVARALGKRSLSVSSRLVRPLMRSAWKAHLIPAHPEWLDMGMLSPLMNADKVRRELGWKAKRDAFGTIEELMKGLAEGAGVETPPLEPDDLGIRLDELKTGIGQR